MGFDHPRRRCQVSLYFLTCFGLVSVITGFSTFATSVSFANKPAHDSDDAPVHFKIPARTDGIIEFLGQEIKTGDGKTKMKPIEVRIAGKLTAFRQLRPGDVVEKGQVIGRINDELLSTELKIKRAELASREAEMASSNKTKEEAYRRWEEAKKLLASKFRDFSIEDARGAELTYHRYARELDSKMAAIDVAKREIDKVKATLESHLIRSSVRGIVRRVHKYPGEAVRNLETVVTVEIVNDDSK